MVFSHLNSKNVVEKYNSAKDRHEQLVEPFPEWARIAQNKPNSSIPKEYPKTTDGTTASIIRKTGRRVVQQLPTGVIKTDDSNDWLPIVAEFILTNKILPFANKDYDLIQKCWSTIENGLTFGSQAVYTPFLKHDDEFSTDYQMVYWGDIFLQPGKKSAYDSNYIFMREWYQKDDIEALIDQETRAAKAAKKAGEAYDSSWDIEALREVLDKLQEKDEIGQTPVEKDRGLSPTAIELVTGFQTGVGADFLTFSPTSKSIVRTKKNKDPRGKMPIDYFYADTDGTNPLGRGVVELIGGLQNLIDADMQMYQYNRALMLSPPVVKRGNFNKNKIVFKPNAIIDLGSDPNARIDALTIDTTAVTNYPSLYGLQKSQLLNLVSSPDTSISAEIGNPGFGKTPSAINAQQANISVDDNFLRKMFEAFFENKCETDINRYFAEREGTEELQLDKKTADRLRKLIIEGKLEADFVSEDGKVLLDYSTATPALRFRIDASTSKMKSDGEQLEALTSLLERLEASPLLQQVIPQEKVIATWNSIVAASGVEDSENLSVDLEEFREQQKAQEQAMAEQQGMAGEEMSQEAPQDGLPDLATMTPEEEAILRQQAAQEAEVIEQPQEPAETQLDDAAIDEIAKDMSAMGYDTQTIAEAIDMHEKGYSADEIIAALQEKDKEAQNV